MTQKIQTQTPWPLVPELQNNSFLRINAGPWPDFPASGLLKEFASKSDLKAIADFRQKRVGLQDQYHAHNFVLCRERANALRQSSSPGAIRETERLSRMADAMSPEVFAKAEAGLSELDQVEREFAAGLCERLADDIYEKVFMVEALAAEARLERFGSQLTEQVRDQNNEPLTLWKLHGDPELGKLFKECWDLKYYFGPQYRTPTYNPELPSGLEQIFARVEG